MTSAQICIIIAIAVYLIAMVFVGVAYSRASKGGADSFGAASPASLDRLREWLAFRDLSSDKLAEPLRSSSVSHSVVTISQDGISVQQISA